MRCQAIQFLLLIIAGAAQGGAEGWCDPIPCSTVGNKVPSVDLPLGDAATKALSEDDKVAFEVLLGQALLRTSAVRSATQAFATRLYDFIVGAGRDMLGLDEEKALLTAFKNGDVHLTGFVGLNAGHIREVLKDWGPNRTANLRNVWSTVYAFSKSSDFKKAFSMAPPKYLASDLGFGPRAFVALEEKRYDVERTQTLPKNLTYAQGVPDYYFPPYDSWVRFSFAVNGRWGGARKTRANISEISWMTDDPRVQPPLSPDETWYQCGGPGPCKLRWIRGTERYYVGEEPLGSWPGLRKRADAAGYATVAGASGTTANIMQLAKLLGFGGEDLVALRAACAAFMLPLRHHSFLEVMLGAEPFMPAGFRMALGLEDLGQLWPRSIRTTWGADLATLDVWGAVGSALGSEPGKALVEKMDAKAAAYLRSLLPQGPPSAASAAVLI